MNKFDLKNLDKNDESAKLINPEGPIYTSRLSTDELDIEDLESCTEGEYSELYETFPEMRRGGYGVVCKARNSISGEEVITKFIYKNYIDDDWYHTFKNLGMVPKEIGILHQLDHPNIIKLLGFYQNKDWYQLVMERHGPGIDLYDFTDRLLQPLPEDLGSYIFQQVISAVKYLHEMCVVHRDIKDENIIIDDRFNIKLVDFGTATNVDHSICSLLDDFEGTTKVFSSPEYLKKEKYDGYAMDIWSLGVTLYLLMYGDTPFETEEEVKLFQGALDFPEKTSLDLKELLMSMLNPIALHRYTINEVCNHVWTTQAVSINSYTFEDVICMEETNWDNIKTERYYTPREEHLVLNLKSLTRLNSESDEGMEDWITVSEINSEDYESEDQLIVQDDEDIRNLTETPTFEDSRMSTEDTDDKQRHNSKEMTLMSEDLGEEQNFIQSSNTLNTFNDFEYCGGDTSLDSSLNNCEKFNDSGIVLSANDRNTVFLQETKPHDDTETNVYSNSMLQHPIDNKLPDDTGTNVYSNSMLDHPADDHCNDGETHFIKFTSQETNLTEQFVNSDATLIKYSCEESDKKMKILANNVETVNIKKNIQTGMNLNMLVNSLPKLYKCNLSKLEINNQSDIKQSELNQTHFLLRPKMSNCEEGPLEKNEGDKVKDKLLNHNKESIIIPSQHLPLEN